MMFLEFEKPAVLMSEKIKELKSIKDVSLEKEIQTLEEKFVRLRKKLTSKLNPVDVVSLSRHPLRPFSQDYIAGIFSRVEEIHGDRLNGDDKAIFAGFGELDGVSLAILAQKKGRTTTEKIALNFGMPMPEGFRKAARLANLAAKFGLPIVTFVDTPGAFPGIAAEERGQAEAIATMLNVLLNVSVPTLSIIVGEGGSGGALALSVTDRLLMQEFSIFSVISPEGCASILFREANKTNMARAASMLKLTAPDLLKLGVIDGIIDEPEGGAHWDKALGISIVKESVRSAFKELMEQPKEERLQKRQDKYLRIGFYE